MTLAPVIGGSERQGFGKYSLCSEKKEQIEKAFKKRSVTRTSAKHMINKVAPQQLTVRKNVNHGENGVKKKKKII